LPKYTSAPAFKGTLWIIETLSQSQTVEAQHGEEVTLQCNNIYNNGAVIFWFRLISCVVVIINYGGKGKVCDGYEKDKIEMKSNISTVFLNIKNVDSSDSGLYYCGFYMNSIPILTPIHLKVNGKMTVFFSLVLFVQFALFCFYCTILFLSENNILYARKYFFKSFFKIKTNVIFILLKGSDEPHDDDREGESKILLKISFIVKVVYQF
uniref:Ig-like domain-containing protein n=1 Tax=Sparus aurata TaxID=8175 RepID=A0A671XXD2_SPAAU